MLFRSAREPSSPPPPAVSPEHVTARVDSSEEEATRTPVHEPSAHEPRVDGPSAHEPSAHEPWVDGPSAHEAPEERTSGWGTWPDEPEGPSGHADDGGEPTDFEEEGEEGGNVYQRGATRLPSVPVTREQRWLIFPDGER